MSTTDLSDKITLIKNILKSITMGASIQELKKKYGKELRRISPFEIAVIEQQLVLDGVTPDQILRVCDLHVELFREYIAATHLEGVPENHPLNLLLRENEEIMKLVEALNLYAASLKKAKSLEEKEKMYTSLRTILGKLKKDIRIHYRKNQMLIFPYLERRGIDAVPRVLWGKEDEIIVESRKLLASKPVTEKDYDEYADKTVELGRKVMDIVFRENKILYPAVWVLLEPGEWRVIHGLAEEIGYLVEPSGEWRTDEEPVYPYMVDGTIPPEKLEKLPTEIKNMLKEIKPDNYQIRKPGDVELENGFLSPEEITLVFSSLPLELTYADENDRVRFFTKSRLTGGFPRAKTIIGRKLEYCHPPRLEGYVKYNVNLLKQGRFTHREFWTRMGNRIIRVLIVGIKDGDGNYKGTLEIVEDFTDIVNNPEKIKERIVVL